MEFTDDELVISFASIILTQQNAHIGMAFRFVTYSKKEFVLHVDTKLLLDQLELFLSFRQKRMRLLTEEQFQEYLESINMNKKIHSIYFPEVTTDDLERSDSRSAFDLAYYELPDIVKVIVTHKDKSTRSLVLSDCEVFKMIENTERFLAIAGIPLAGNRSVLH